jgi:predicted deacylase
MIQDGAWGAVEVAGARVAPGQRVRAAIAIAELATQQSVGLPLLIQRGRAPGRTLLVTAAIHGDELVGIEICARLLARAELSRMAGMLILAPVANVFGFLNRDRYLPDRRDLNRSFPGSAKGSLAGRIASALMKEVVCEADALVDLHSAAIHRTNAPQVRADLDHPGCAVLAEAFAAPLLVHAETRPGSLRACATARGVPAIVYEAGEALRIEEPDVRAGLDGVLRVMAHLGMIDAAPPPDGPVATLHDSTWLRAPGAGIVRRPVACGARVRAGEPLCVVAGPLGEDPAILEAPRDGFVIGRATTPVVNQGDALFHLAWAERDGPIPDEDGDDASAEPLLWSGGRA